MKVAYSSKKLLKVLNQIGWVIKNQCGSHIQLVHLVTKGKVTIPHPKKDLTHETIQSIFRQAGLKF